jgi:hypothetical protein
MPDDDLLTYVFPDGAHPLAAPFAGWLAASPRFRAFAVTYRDKIRKKARHLRDEEGWRDLHFELAVAYWLLQERRFEVAYEAYGVGGQRAPDFCVTYRTHTRFNVEVKRMRAARLVVSEPGVPHEPEEPHELRDGEPVAAHEADSGRESGATRRLVRTVCDKLGQLPPSIANVLALGTEGDAYAEGDVAQAMKRLQERAARKDEDFFTQRGYASARDFLRHYQRLSGILVYGAWDGAALPRPGLWLNSHARHPLPREIATLLHR